MVGHSVIDRKTLTRAGVQLVGVFFTLYTILIAMVERPAEHSNPSNSSGVCSLNEFEVGVIQAVVRQRFNLTSPCLMNATLASIMSV
jgi:hypothetical protein